MILKKINALTERVEALENLVNILSTDNTVLKARLSCISEDSGEDDLFLEGCNVHVLNGIGYTDSQNAKGNLIVGYNEDTFDGPNDRTGSHNLIIGSEHTYSSFGGFVAGFRNTISGEVASVSGGENNTASGFAASVSAGNNNIASGQWSSVSGGGETNPNFGNRALGDLSSVSGGQDNETSGLASSISAGRFNFASGIRSSISGGSNNHATAKWTSTVPAGSV